MYIAKRIYGLSTIRETAGQSACPERKLLLRVNDLLPVRNRMRAGKSKGKTSHMELMGILAQPVVRFLLVSGTGRIGNIPLSIGI